MKNTCHYFICLFILFQLSFYHLAKSQTVKKLNTEQAKSNKSNIMIDAEGNYTLSKSKVGPLLKECPEFIFKKYEIVSPDESILRHNDKDFNCEACKDDYFRLYAYFLNQADSGGKYDNQRKKLIKIYRTINGIYEGLEQGGNYFGHMHLRILGYAEYSVYLGKEGEFEKKYNISRQKALYILSIKQIISDEVNLNNDIPLKMKPKLKTELLKMATQLNGLITDYFYLESAMNFQYTNYSYML